jgi:hypothetical protein
MMELRHIAMVNWHLFDVEDIELGGHIGVLGENRSGKSTVLDMCQVVLTGGNKHFLRLNAVAGEARSTSKRNVVGYCLGALGEDDLRREQARTYIAMGFADTEGKRPPVTIGMAIEARKSESNETVLGRFVVVGRILTASDFIEEKKAGKFPAEWDEVRTRIVASVGEERFINHRDKAVDYVREYMRHLLPHASFIGEQAANSLQKAIVNAMTMDHGHTATDFVREFVLERNPMRVGELRESIQTYRNINETIRKMRGRLDALKVLREILSALEDAYERKYRERWIAKRAEWLASRAANRAVREKYRAECEARDAAKAELKFLDDDLKAIEPDIERLDVAIVEHDTNTGRHAQHEASRIASETVARAAADFDRRMKAIRSLQPIRGMKGPVFDAHMPAVQDLLFLAKDARVDRMPARLPEADAKLAEFGTGLLTQVDEARQKLFKDAGEHKEKRDAIRQRIRQHAAGQGNVHLGQSTEDLCRKLRQAGMAPRVLCNLVEVARPEWTAAAEGLLGRDREAIFVDRPQVSQATAIFKEGRREFRGASLVSLNKLDAHRNAPQAGTFPSIFRTQDADAMAFIMRRHNSVRLANTLNEFNQPGRAIMKDGLYDDGLVRTHRAAEASDFKIGKEAQANVLRDLQEQAERLDELASAADKTAGEADSAHAALKHLLDDQTSNTAALAQTYTAALARKTEAEERIAALDGKGDGGLREKRDVQRELKKARRDERLTQQDAFNGHEVEAKLNHRKLSDGENAPGSVLNLKITWSKFLGVLPLYDRGKGRAAYRVRLDGMQQKTETDRHRAIATKATNDGTAADDQLAKDERRVREALGAYFDEFGVSSQIGTESEPLREVKPWMQQLIDEIETNELRKYEHQARQAAEKAATLLRGEFINALTSRISKMERDLTAMNRSLYDHPLHNERYSFHHTRLAEFEPILRIIEIGKTSPEALDMLFRGDEVPEDFPHKDTIAALEALLEDPEKDFMKFEDYRNFYTFEIHMEDVVSGRRTRWETRRGTGSGAEKQVPIYVAIGASLASVYGSAERRAGQPAGIALAIFDEAFSKMDGKNQRQMMSFYKKLGLQVVIAAPYEKRVTILEHMDTIVEIDRIGDGARATMVHLKEKAHRELRGMDPDMITDADLQTRDAAE